MKKRVTMKEIADRLNLSINAVSLALNDRAGVSEETRRLVLNAAEEMGYLDQSTRYTAAYSNKNICILLEDRFFKDMQFYGRILLGLEEAAKKAGYDLFINSFEKNQEIPACVEQQKVSGLIVVGKIDDEYLKRLKSYSIPVLLLDHESVETPTDCVMTNNVAGAYKLTKYLLDKGYRKIGFFGDLTYTPSIRERFWGYQEAMQQCHNFPSLEDGIAYIRRYSALRDVEDAVIHQDAAGLAAFYQAL
ncbi:transcriptional regulator, LacI family, partial [Hungatella hathewayi DSM 13479]